MSHPAPRNYGKLLSELKERIRSAQYQALRAVNRELLSLYWDIGRLIVERQKKEKWGRAVVERLATDLQAEFPGTRGFSTKNLWKMKQFYEAYAGNEKLSPLVREIAWTHNAMIFLRCKNDLQREFYIRMVRKFGWSKNVLMHHIDNRTYEKTLLNQVNFEKTLPKNIRNQARLAVRDEYAFGFLELGEEHAERDLERGLVARIERFLREMGGMFHFVGSQYRLEVGGEEFFIDILLYHRHLRSYVAIELKVGRFMPEYVGKMQFYLAALDGLVRLPHDRPSMGIIICRDKNRTIVEYALRESRQPIGVAVYSAVSDLPEELRGQMPEPEQVALLMAEAWE